jgi:hypothetical protein
VIVFGLYTYYGCIVCAIVSAVRFSFGPLHARRPFFKKMSHDQIHIC